MKSLIQEYIPHAPQIGLYAAPQIPPDKLRNAVRDYARGVEEQTVLALYDATLMGSAKDGAVFLADRFVYQDNDLQPPQEIRYGDIVRVDTKRKLLGGREIILDVNRGHATVTHTMDFSGKADAAEYVARFLHEAMIHGVHPGEPASPTASPASPAGFSPAGSDLARVRSALEALRAEGALAEADFRKLLDALGRK